MKRLLLALLLLVPTFGAATLPSLDQASDPWPNCLPCPRVAMPGDLPIGGSGGE
jgi:hypothetical protein